MTREERIIKLVTEYTHIPFEIAISKTRKREVCETRQLISYYVTSYTTLSFWAIARMLKYKSHASVIRDRRQVNTFFTQDRQWILRYQMLDEKAKKLADRFKKEEEQPETINLMPGTLCWFWNNQMSFPKLGTFRSFRLKNENEIWFRSNEEPITDYPRCAYAGDRVIPSDFKKPDFIDEEMDIFYEEAMIEPEALCIS